MAYCIMRMDKKKSTRDVVMSLDHNDRERMPNNADPEKTPKNLVYGGTTAECMNRFQGLMPEKIRKNAVVAVELVFTASPEFDGNWGGYLRACLNWGLETFGIDPEKKDIRPAIQYAVHHDEKTQHLHLTIVPLKDGKLNAKHYIGGSRDRMAELQNDFYEKVGKEFDLNRGKPRAETKARHTQHNMTDLAEKEKALEDFQKVLAARDAGLSENISANKNLALKLEAREAAVNNALKNAGQAQQIAARLTEHLHGSTAPEIQKFWPRFWEKVPEFVNGIKTEVKAELAEEKQLNRQNTHEAARGKGR